MLQALLYSYAYEQLQAVTPFIKDNSGALYWQPEVKTAFITHKAKSRGAPIKSLWPIAGRSCWSTEASAYLPIKDHLVAFPVFDLVVEVLRQLQAFIYLSLEPDSALQKT